MLEAVADLSRLHRKYYCDYCDVFLTHDSTSVRKAHNAGRNHLQNVKDYYAGLGHDKAQSIIDEIVRVYERGGPPGPVGTMFPGALAQGGPSGLPSAPPPAAAAPQQMPAMPAMPPSGMPMPPAGMPQPPPGNMPMPPMGMPLPNRGGPPAPNQPLGLPPLPEAGAGAGPAPPTDGPKINPQRAAALGLT